MASAISFGGRRKSKCHFSWQPQYLVKSKSLFSWQGQYFVKFGIIAGARNVVFFNTKCSVSAMLESCSDHGRNGLGSCSDRPRIENDVSAVLRKFVTYLGSSLFVAGAIFGEVGH